MEFSLQGDLGLIIVANGFVFLLGLVPMAALAGVPDANTIIERSVQVFDRDWKTAPEYDYFERDTANNGTRTYHVMMILGSPYSHLVAVDGMPLSSQQQQEEQQKLQSVIARRCGETKRQAEQRIRKYEQSREHDHRLINELTAAFVFHVLGDQTVDGHATWLLQSSPRPGYHPSNRETKVLTGMQGKLWIDQAAFEWVKVEARVINPVSIEGFLAKVEPGTEFELARAPGPGSIWFGKHFLVSAKSSILSLFPHNTRDDETYFNYQKSGFAKARDCRVKR